MCSEVLVAKSAELVFKIDAMVEVTFPRLKPTNTT
jgi:hypothetical protein